MELDQAFIDFLMGNAEVPNLSLPDPNILDTYTMLKNRVYWLNRDITNQTLDLADKIIKWNRYDKSKEIPIEERKPIRILFFSNGGSLEVEEVLTSIISISETPVYGIAIGFTASAATMIYLACHKRYALPNVRFMFHKGSANGINGSYMEIESFMQDYKKQIDSMVTFYKSHTTFPPEIIEQKLNTGDWYVNIDEAVENGVVDEVIKDFSVFI